MSYYLKIEKIGEETQVKGIVHEKEFFLASGKPGDEWKVVMKEPLPDSLDQCLEISNLFNRVVVEAKKLRAENDIKDLNFSFINISKEDLDNRFDTEVYELGTRDDMEIGEVRDVVFRDIDGKLFKVVYSCYMEYDYTRHIHIDSYEEIQC